MVNSRAKGIDRGERPAARYFAAQGPPWDNTRRAVGAGWSNGTVGELDKGDILLPGLCVQVKNLAKPLTGKALDDVMAATQLQAEQTGRMPLLLEKRQGSADVGRWWLWMWNVDYVRVVTGRAAWIPNQHLVRVSLGDIVDDLRTFSRESL
jgi:hypothetical protein